MPIYELRGVSNDAWTCDNYQNSDLLSLIIHW